jgi:cob(I)alamin adenosyltransferase
MTLHTPKHPSHEVNMSNGLLCVLTGDGKGKTTAAWGMVLRAAGHGMRICVIQFIKGSWRYGEIEAFKRFDKLIDFRVMGRGFTWKSEDFAQDQAMAQQAWQKAEGVIKANAHQLVILDELTYLPLYNMVSIDAITATLRARPPALHVVVTGRRAPAELIAIADLVTEMQAIKHPYQHGIKAQKGIEF